MVGPGIANTSVANRCGGYAVEAREVRVGDSRYSDAVDFGGVEPSSGRIRGRDRYRKYVSWLVAGACYGLIYGTTGTGRQAEPPPERARNADSPA